MKKTYPLLSLLGLTFILFSCGGGGDNGKPSGPITPDKVAVTSVSVSKTTADLEIGSTLQLSATVSPSNATDKSVTWSSSNASAATVTPTGLVTGKAEGTSNITATAGGKSATCKVTVKKPAVAVTSVELDKTEITLDSDESYTLKATVKPDDATVKTVTWGSSKESVATVDQNGKVTGVDNGTASITATSGDITASCKVNVVVQVKSISLDRTSAIIELGDEWLSLHATTTPDNAVDQTVTWSSSNTSVAAVHFGTIQPISVGMATITAKAGNKTATCDVTIVDRFSIGCSILFLPVGATETLTAIENPVEARSFVTWTSSDPSVASVSATGIVRGIKIGSTKITATCGDKTSETVVRVENVRHTVKAVDMGVPDGRLWSDRNLGAATPEVYGLDFAYGETESKSDFSIDNYKFYDKNTNKYTVSFANYNYTMLPAEYDAAATQLGECWHVPTEVEVSRLFDRCDRTIFQLPNGKWVCKLTSRITGNSILLPSSGFNASYSQGSFWTCHVKHFIEYDLYSNTIRTLSGDIWSGHNIRPVYYEKHH